MAKDLPKPIETIETNFAGNLLINSRTITNTDKLFRKIISGPRSARKINVTELSELLVLLEAIATSNRLVYDGTVPQGEIDKVRLAEQTLEDRIGDANVFDAIQPETDTQMLALCTFGIQQASRLLRKRIELFGGSPADIGKKLNGVRRLDPNMARKFAQELLQEPPPNDDCAAYAADLIRRNPFNGAKCVAGLLLVASGNDALRDNASEEDITTLCRAMVADRSDDDLCWIVPMFIDSFRSNFLNSLGAEHGGAAFFAGPAIEHAMEQQVFLLGSYVGARLTEEALQRDILKSAMENRLTSTSQFPFIGLMVLLSAEDGEPFSVFRTSLDDKETLLAEFLARQGGQKRFIHDLDQEALQEFKQAKLEPIFRRMQQRVAIHDHVDRVNKRIIQPAISWYAFIRPALNALLGQIDDDYRAPEGQPGAGAALEYAVNDALLPGEYLRYASFTHRIRGRVEAILQDRDGMQNLLTTRVREVLDCELVPDPEP